MQAIIGEHLRGVTTVAAGRGDIDEGDAIIPAAGVCGGVEIVDLAGDLGRARHAAFDSVEWRGELAGGPPFVLTARLEPETPSQMDDPCKANAVAAAPDCWDVAARLRIGNY